jgi:hypothetical protein
MRSSNTNGSRLLTGVPVVMTLTLGRANHETDESGPNSPVTLSFADLFTTGAPTLRLSPAAEQLAGRRVRLVGFMAQMARGPRGGFYLCPRPVTVDDRASGKADLPPEAVRVTLPAANAAGRTVPFVPGRVEVIGLLDVGYRDEGDGEVSWVRLTTGGAHSQARR